MRASRNVGEGLVDRDPLHQRREIPEDPDRRIAQTLILVEMAAHEGELRAEAAGAPSRHAALDAEGPGLIRSRQHDATANGDRPSAQGRVEQLLDRGVESIEVRMENRGGHRNPARWNIKRTFCPAGVKRLHRKGTGKEPEKPVILLRGTTHHHL
jgi:hypothetical protein